jgi:hypothetical protein
MLLSKQKTKWPSLQLPEKEYSLTVDDVLKEDLGEKRERMFQRWMLDVWGSGNISTTGLEKLLIRY